MSALIRVVLTPLLEEVLMKNLERGIQTLIARVLLLALVLNTSSASREWMRLLKPRVGPSSSALINHLINQQPTHRVDCPSDSSVARRRN